MKKLYLLILIQMLLVGLCKAQPSFSRSSFPGVGFAATTYDVSSAILSPGNAGANQTWNFGSVTGSGATNTLTMVTPTSTGFGSMFPSSDLAASTVSAGGNPAFAFYQTSSSVIYLIGAGTNGTIPVMLQYSNPLTAITFPWTYNSMITDTYNATATYTVSGTTVMIYRRGQVNVLADGYGTLTTPNGVYTNCLRTKTIDSSVDSILYVGIPIPATISTNNSTSYNYFEPGTLIQRFQMVFDTSNTSGTPTPSFSASYSSFSSSLPVLKEKKDLSIYPNPAIYANEINLGTTEMNNGNASISIYNLNGNLVKRFETTILPGQPLPIDISEWSHGIYTIQVDQENRLFTSQMIR